IAAALIYLHVADTLPWANLINIVEFYVEKGLLHTGRVFKEQAGQARQTDPKDWEKTCRKALGQGTGTFDSHPCLRERRGAGDVWNRWALRLMIDRTSPPARKLIADWPKVEDLLGKKLTAQYRIYYEENRQAKEELAAIIRHISK